MVTQTFGISGHPREGATRETRADGQMLRHRLDVLAADTADVVQTTGGWLFDRVMAGWEVNVLLPHGCPARPLRVLGVQVLDLESELRAAGPMSPSLAVSVDAFIAHECVRELVRRAVDNRLTEVALWGEGWPLGVNRRLTRTQYRLSAAARAFKGQALRAAGIPYLSIDHTETLFTDSAWLG
jgi:hypothetical protein